jgi:hypothetical protein
LFSTILYWFGFPLKSLKMIVVPVLSQVKVPFSSNTFPSPLPSYFVFSTKVKSLFNVISMAIPSQSAQGVIPLCLSC